MSHPHPLYDPSDPQDNPDGFKKYKSKIAKKMNDGKAPLDKLSKRFSKHAKTWESASKFKSSKKPF